MDFEFNPISKPVANFVFVIAGFMTAFGIYFLSQMEQSDYAFYIPVGMMFVPWLPFWAWVYLTSKIRFTSNKIIKSSGLGKRVLLKEKIRFFGVVFRGRYTFRIIPPEKAAEFSLYGNCQIFISEKPESLIRGTQKETIKIPFQQEVYDKIKAWMETEL